MSANGMFLTAPDEYFNHQAAVPHFMVGVSDPNWRERYWVSIQNVVTQDFIMSIGFGKYPNKDIMEGFAIAQYGTRQWNLRISRQLLPKSDSIEVGPLCAEILEPLRTIRLRLDPNASGLAFDLLWRADLAPMLEGRHFELNRARVTHDLVRYVQLGRVEGRIDLPGRAVTLTPETGWGERDHSWGVRPMRSVAGDPPVASAAWNFLMFCPIQFQQFAVHIYLFESQAARPTHLSASIVRRADDLGDTEVQTIEHDLVWEERAPIRTLKGGSISLVLVSGEKLTVDLRPLAPRVYLKGGGYGVDHGQWKGEYHIEHEEWDLSTAEALKGYVLGSSDHMIEATCNGQTGYGIIEYVVRSAHQKYGRPNHRRE
jgi:hypothetical protein